MTTTECSCKDDLLKKGLETWCDVTKTIGSGLVKIGNQLEDISALVFDMFVE